jgi:hypothetical protein
MVDCQYRPPFEVAPYYRTTCRVRQYLTKQGLGFFDRFVAGELGTDYLIGCTFIRYQPGFTA